MVRKLIVEKRFKTPMVHRLLALLLTTMPLSVLASAPPSSKATADDAVQSALAVPGVQEAYDARLEKARAVAAGVTVRPTPTLGLTHEQVFGDINVGYTETTAALEQQIDLSGWRRKFKSGLPHREAALRSEAQAWRLQVSTATRLAFFEVRYRQARIVSLEAWVERLGVGLRGLEARQGRGDASAYATKRMQRELDLAKARAAAERVARAQAWSELESWTSWDQRPALDGVLEPEIAVDTVVVSRPELEQLRHLDQALVSEAAAWKSPVLRGWSVGAGYRHARVGQSVGHGFVVSLALPLAFWNPDGPTARLASAQAAKVRGELETRSYRAERVSEAAKQRLAETRAALDELGDPKDDAELSQMAALAFGSGEASLTELLDAYESETELRLARIDLQWGARQAFIALQHSRGVGVPK